MFRAPITQSTSRSGDGVIPTNAHTVDRAKELAVRLSDHQEFKANVLRSDHASNSAVIKIDARALPTVRRVADRR
jgi:serine protease Do